MIKKRFRFLAAALLCVLLIQSIWPLSVSAASNSYVSGMEGMLDRILARYGASADDDWEWMVEGIAQNREANTGGTFDLAVSVKRLDTSSAVALTNLARKVMSLTARGFDCTRLASYNGGKALPDSGGNQIDNLVSLIYNYSGLYTINGPAFALIALDMGNYSVPGDAVWTREALLETLLEHEYLSDGFDTDMVAMIMYSIAPYRSDETYGARVRAKLEEGVAIIAERMSDDYTFDFTGTATSETASQVICALSACGIDCHTDERFSNGRKSVLTQWLQFADQEQGYFRHVLGGASNAMATYQGAYTLQWYLGFLEGGGSGHPYDLYKNRFDFSSEFEKEADIRAFSLEGQDGVIDAENGSVTVTMPRGASLNRLTPEFTLSDGAKLLSPELPCTFAEGVAQPFVVQAADGKTRRVWSVTVQYGDVQGAASRIDTSTLELWDKNKRALEILDMEVQGNDIRITVSEGTDVTSLGVKASISDGASSSPALDGTALQDLSSWKSFTVTAQDGQHRTVYRICAETEQSARIESFRLNIGGTAYTGRIDGTTILITGVPADADVTAAVPTIQVSSGANCMPLSGVPQNFTNAVEYTVSGEGLKSRIYTVIVETSGQGTASELWDRMWEESSVDSSDPDGEPWWEKAARSRRDNDYPEYW